MPRKMSEKRARKLAKELCIEFRPIMLNETEPALVITLEELQSLHDGTDWA